MEDGKIYGSENRRKLYDNLTKDGFDLGTLEDFNRNMDDNNVRRSIYDAAKDAGWEVPEYDQFDRDMSVKRMKIGGKMQEVDHATYDDFMKRHPSGTNVKPKPKPQQASTPKPSSQQRPDSVSAEQGYIFTEEGLDSAFNQGYPVSAVESAPASKPAPAPAPVKPEKAEQKGTPWGTAGSATGQGRAYKPTAPGQVRETGDPGATQFGVPYKPDTQLTAAQRDEIYRQNDYAVKQIQKLRDEETRRNQPLVDTGSPEANKSIIKPQGQWEDELQKGVSDISKSVVAPAVSKAIADFDKKAHEVFEETKEEGNAYGGLPTGTASGATIFGSVKESNKANDPEKVLNYLKGQMEALYKDQSFIDKVGQEADKVGIDRNEYLEKVVKPQIEADLGKQFDSAMIDKYLPKSGKEYVVSGLSNSIIGMLADAFLETKGQRAYKNQAAAMTEEGRNPYYNPGTGAKLAQMGVSFAADAPFFGIYGKVSGQVAKQVAERNIQKLVSKGLSEGAARSIVGSALENSVGARMKNYIMQHVIGGSLTMGGYNFTSEGARQLRDKEFDPMKLAGSTAEGLAVGSAFGLTGGVSQALSQPLSGFAKIGAKAAGFGAEAETMYATEELSKMTQGEEGFTNPFEGSVESLMKLGVMKLSGGHLVGKAGEKILRAKEVGARQTAIESLAEMLGQSKTGMKFTEDEQDYIRNSQEGKDLVESLANMHPDRSIEEVNGKKKLTKEGEQQRQQLADNYNRFMSNTEIPSDVKQKVSQMLGGIYRPGLETGVTITQNEDGSVLLKTRDKDGNCVRDLKFDDLAEAEQWRDQFKSQMSRNDAVNMFNSAPDDVKQNIVNIVRDAVSGKTELDELKNQAGSMKQNRLKRQLEKINQATEHYEGREMTDEEARNYIQTVIRDGDDAVFGDMYDLIRENVHPSDQLDTKRNYWEGQQLSAVDRHKAQVDAQLAEERLRLQGDDFAEEVIGAADYPDEKMAELAMRASSGRITGDQLKAALDYYNKTSKVRGMMDEAATDIDNQVEAANAYVRRNTHPDSGTLIDGSYRGRDYYVTAGHFQISPDGRLVPTDNSGLVILRDKETGEIVTANPNDVLVNGVQNPNRLIAYNESMEGLRGQLVKDADDSIELHPDTPTDAANGDIYMASDGNMYMAMQIQDEAGNPLWAKIAIDETGNPVGDPMPFDMDEYRKAKSDEKDAADIPPEEAAVIVENRIQSEGTDNPVNDNTTDPSLGAKEAVAEVQNQGIDVQPHTDVTGNKDAAGTGVKEEPVPAPEVPVSRIPVGENGKKIYEQATPEDTIAELTEKYGEEQAQQMISKIAESTAKALDEIQNRDTSKITDMAELEAYQDEVVAAQQKADYWKNLVKPKEPKVEQLKTEEPAASVEPEKPVEPEKSVEPEKPVTPPVEPEKPARPTAEQKIAQGTVKNNISKRFGFQNQDGTRSEVTIDAFKGDDMVEVTRQDYDAQGRPNGEPYKQDLNMVDVGNSIINGVLRPVLSTEEKLRLAYKGKTGMQNVIDVLSDAEQRQMLDAIERGDEDAVRDLTNEFLESHHEDIILNERDKRNANVNRIMEGGGSREDKLRRVRKEYQGYDDAVIALSDESMQPTTLEEYVADLHSRQPKAGEGPLAYFSYDQDGKEVVGMQDETGFGTKTGGDTDGFKPWLAPKGKGVSLQQYAEKIHSQLPESVQQQYSDQDVRNAILSVFGGAERPSDITTMVIRRGVIQAEQAARRMEEMWIDNPSLQKVSPDDNTFAGRLARAKEQTNTEPSEAQKEKGNYKKGHISFGGYDFTIENPAGSVRRGEDATGRKWEQKMNNTYGYILGKRGKDGDHLDFFINDKADLDNWNGNVYVVDQIKPDGSFDEHKILYGFDSEAEAREAYLSNYEKNWKGLGKITGVDKATFDKWLDASDYKIKDFADYSIVKHKVEQQMRNFDDALKQLSTRGISIDNQELLDKYGLKNVVLSKSGDHLTLTHFIVDQQGQGYGTRFMEDLARLADEKGWTLALTPGLGFGAKSKKKLEEFYKRFGFVANKGRNADFQTRESMIRRPKEFMEKPENQEKVIRDAIVEYLKSIGIEVSDDWQLGQKILDDYNRKLEVNEEPEDPIKSQKVYHGSGVKFDAFDHSHMGEGAGSQSFGWGTYVTKSNGIAKSYAKLANQRRYKGKTFDDLRFSKNEKERIAGDVLDGIDGGRGFEKVINNVREHIIKERYGYHNTKDNLDFLDSLKREDFKVGRNKYLYDVEIPDESDGYYIDYKGRMGDQKDVLEMVDNSLTADGWKRQEIDSRVKFTKGDKQIILTPNQSGADLYAELEDALGSDKAASQFLNKTGITGMKYPAGTIMGGGNGATNYVIFNENDAKITDRTKFFKTPDGHAYGYTKGGKIYLDPRIATSETPVHEYDHLWCEMKRQTAPEEWDQMKQVMLTDKLVQPIIDRVKRDYPELTKEGKEDDFVEEIITQFSGKRGAERLREVAEEVAKENGGVFGKAEAVTAMQRLKNILNRFWEGVAKMMGWKYRNANQIADRMMADMLNGVDPTKIMKDAASGNLRSQAEIERTLMGVHNISEEKLKKALKQGGLANPSLAVFDTKNYAHTDYGEISLIPRSSLIDSRTGRNAGTFSGDAWTPTYPRVEKFLTKKGDKHRLKIAKEAAGGDEEMERHLAGVINDYVEGNGDRMHFLFLKQKGLNPEVRPERTTHSHEEFEEIQKIFGEGTSTLPSSGITKEQNQALLDLMTRGYEEQVRKQAEMIKDESKREAAVKVMLDRELNDLVDENGNVWFAEGDSFVYENWRDEQRRKNPKPDWYGTDNDASYRVAKEGLAEEYEKWKENLLNDEDIDEKLFAGWTADGQKRYVSNTVQNASRLMNKEAEANAYGNGGVNASKSVLLKKLKTLSDIRKYRHLLKSEDQIKEQAQQASDEWFDIIHQVSDMQKVDSNRFINVDIAEARLQEAMTKRDPIGYLNKEYGYDIDRNSDLASDLMNFIEKAKEMPVKYFETKFERPVGIDEFAIAVVPTTTSPEVVEALKNAGLDVRTYDASDYDRKDENRTKVAMDAVRNRDDILFQRADSRDKEYADAVASGDMEKVDAMLREEAKRKGYDENSDYQGSLAFNGAAPSKNGYFETREERKQAMEDGSFEDTFSLGDYAEAGIDSHDLEWQLANPIPASAGDKATLSSIRNLNNAIKSKSGKIKMYRAVDAAVKENSFRNGDWVTPSREYAEQHIELQDWKKGRIIEQEVPIDDIWWNGDDINEWGYDDGKGYAYKNTRNNRKLMEPTYDEDGKLIPLSERFNEKKADIKYQMVGRKGAEKADEADNDSERVRTLNVAKDATKAGIDPKAIKLATGWEQGKDGKWRYEIPDADRDILSIYQNEFKNADKKYQEKKKELDALTSEWDKQGEELLSQIGPDGKGMSREEFNKRLEPISKKVKEMRQEVEHLGKLRDNLSPILKLGDLLGEDNELFKYYPEMKKMQVLFDKNMQDGVSGSFDGSNISINARETGRFGDHELNNENIYGTLLHEVQHAIQYIEGFAQGGNLQTSTTEAGINAIIEKKQRQAADIKQHLDANRKILNNPEDLKLAAEMEGKSEKEVKDRLLETIDQQALDYDRLQLQIDKIQHTKSPAKSDAVDLYNRLAGEVESRNVENRMKMTPEERRNSLALETEDVPREDQVIIMSNGKAMNINDVKPVGTGDFGDIYDQFKGKPKEAVEFLLKKKGGEAVGALSHKDVGDIDLVWGEEGTGKSDGFGLAKLAKYHPEVLDNLQEILDDMHVTKRTKNRVNLESDTHQAAVRLTWNDEKKNWLLTAFEKKNSALDNTTDTGKTSEGGLRNDTATPQSTVSEGKDTKNIDTLQENQEKSTSEAQENENNSLKFQRVGSPEPEMTPEERQYWNQWSADMKKWRERNAIPEGTDGPGEKPKFQRGENAIEYAKRLVPWARANKIWQTAPKLEDYRQKREVKDIVESAREEEKRYPDSPLAKMRRVAAEFQQIRSAMNQQKSYDKATVKAVTDFAQEFMKQGFGDHLSRGEMERMLSSVKNATGAKDIRKEVDNIMNILIDNHLRNLDQQVQKLSSTKELKQTAQGVEAQGKLELKGQRMIQAFREARQGRMDAEKIRERMNEVAEKMARDDDEAPMWEQEYEGLSLALRYQDDIEASRDEYKDLERQYKDAVADYKTSGRSYKAQQELLESLDQAMMENKIERIGLFGDIIGRLQGNISESMEGAREFVEREKERVNHIHRIANFDLAGKSSNTSRREDRMDRVLKNDMLQLAFSPLATFEQMLKQFGGMNVKGEGNLYNYFMRNYIDSVDKAYTGTVQAREELDTKARELFGDKIKHWSDLYSITSKPGMKITYLDGENEVTENLSQGNMLYIYMANKMSDGKMKLRKMGITEEDVDTIKDALDPRLVGLGDWLQSEYLPQKRTEYNKVHERMFGAPMAAIDNYFPIKVNRDAAWQDADKYITSEEGDKLPSSITGSIIKRTRNALPLDILHTDALSLAMEHLEDMEQWKAQAEFNRDVKDLLSYTTFRNKVKNMKTIYGSGTPLWNKFFDAATIATGDYNPKRGIADKTITNIAKGVTAAKINFRVYTAFKQLLSLPAFFHDVKTSDMANAMLPHNYFRNNFKWAMENMPVFRKRWQSRQIGDTRLMDDPSDWKLWKKGWMQKIQMGGMMANATIDALTCAAGAKAIYDTRYKKYKDIGASDEVARKRALQDAEIGYNLTQQSNEGVFTSAIQRDRTVAANALSVFRNSSMSYTRQWVDAVRNLKKMSQKGYKDDSVKFMSRQFQNDLGLNEEQAQKAAELEYAKAGRHEFAKMLNMMFGVTALWNMGASLPYLIFGDDDKTRKEMLTDAIAKSLAAGPTEGLAGGNIWSDLMGLATNESVRKAYANSFNEGWEQTKKNIGEYEINPLPLLADLDRLIGKTGRDGYEAAQDLFNIAAQSYTGVNPQTITDIWNAAMDYGALDWFPGVDKGKHNENLSNAKEIALFIMRVLNAPTSSWRNKYIDELGMNAEDAKKLSYEEMARRYANYKHWKDAPIMGWLRSDEEREEKIGKLQKQFDKAVKERLARADYEALQDDLDNTDDEEMKKAIFTTMKGQAKSLTDKDLLKLQTASKNTEERKMLAGLIKDKAKKAVSGISDEALSDSINSTTSLDRKNAFASEYAKRQGAQDYYGKSNSNVVYQQMRTHEDIREDIQLSELYKQVKESGDEKALKAINKLRRKISAQRNKLGDDEETNAEMMKDIRAWRREALERALKVEIKDKK